MNVSKSILTSCIIVAAGSGSRMKSETNKQFMPIGGVPMLALTIKAFESCESVNEIIVVMNKNDIAYCRENIVKAYDFKKVSEIAEGGATRQRSVCNGLKCVSKNAAIVLVHDGARPFVDNDTILRCISAADKYGASCAAIPARDTIKQSDSQGFVLSTPDRDSIWVVQTPQGFKRDILVHAHEKAIAEEFTGTDDAVLAERAGYKLKLTEGSSFNIKITTGEDIPIAEAVYNIVNDG